MRRDSEYFGQAELDLVYMARRLREALKLEDVLARAGIEFLVETGTYTAGLLIKRDLTGAFFYVSPSDLEAARRTLTANGFKPYEPE
jgi:hypothetical protein